MPHSEADGQNQQLLKQLFKLFKRVWIQNYQQKVAIKSKDKKYTQKQHMTPRVQTYSDKVISWDEKDYIKTSEKKSDKILLNDFIRLQCPKH